MNKIDKYPSTPAKAIWAQVATVIFFGYSIYWIDSNKDINMTLYGILAASVLGHDVNAAWQFAKKRATAWKPKDPPTSSEATQPATSGQPAETDDNRITIAADNLHSARGRADD